MKGKEESTFSIITLRVIRLNKSSVIVNRNHRLSNVKSLCMFFIIDGEKLNCPSWRMWNNHKQSRVIASFTWQFIFFSQKVFHNLRGKAEKKLEAYYWCAYFNRHQSMQNMWLRGGRIMRQFWKSQNSYLIFFNGNDRKWINWVLILECFEMKKVLLS